MYAARTITQARFIGSAHLVRPARSRFASSVPHRQPGSGEINRVAGYILAGVTGGALVIAGGYAYYHFSGLKNIVATARSIHASVKSATSSFTNKSSSSPYVALRYLRSVAKSYAAVVPGSGFLVDSAFDNVDDLARTHGDEVDRIAQSALNELANIAKGSRADIATAVEVAQVLKSRGEELTHLAIRVASAESEKLLRPFFEEHPGLKEQLGGAWDEMRHVAQKSRSPEVVKMVKDSAARVVEILKQGLSGESIDQARQVLREKSDEIRKTTIDGGSSGARQARETWDKAVQSTRPYLDKVTSIKSIIEENAAFFSSSPAASASAASILEEVREWMTSRDEGGSGERMSKGRVERLREYVRQKIGKARQESRDLGNDLDDDRMGQERRGNPWEGMRAYVESSAFSEEIPDLSLLSKMVQQDSEEGKKFARETYEDVLRVLKKRIKEANRIANSPQKDPKAEGDRQ